MKSNVIVQHGTSRNFLPFAANFNPQTSYAQERSLSEIIDNTEQLLLQMLNAPPLSKILFLATSGVTAMEASILNLVAPEQHALTIAGGKSGQQFADICSLHQRKYSVYKPAINDNLSSTDKLSVYRNHNALLISGHETSTCHKFSLEATGDFCRQAEMLHIVDGTSLFLSDELDMQAQKIDTLMIDYQTDEASSSELSMIILTPNAISQLVPETLPLDLWFSDYLSYDKYAYMPHLAKRLSMIQLEKRLQLLQKNNGIKASIAYTKSIAELFRKGISNLPLKLESRFMANAMTALTPLYGHSASRIVSDLENQYGLSLSPCVDENNDNFFRISHSGNTTISETKRLIAAMQDYFW